jgi:hypothetical protein
MYLLAHDPWKCSYPESIAWTSGEAFKSFVGNPLFKEEVMPKVAASVNMAKKEQFQVALFSFSWSLDRLSTILAAPVISFVLLEAKSAELAGETLKAIEALVAGIENSSGIHGFTVGIHADDEKKFLVLGGWDSVEVSVQILRFKDGGTNKSHRLIWMQPRAKATQNRKKHFLRRDVTCWTCTMSRRRIQRN